MNRNMQHGKWRVGALIFVLLALFFCLAPTPTKESTTELPTPSPTDAMTMAIEKSPVVVAANPSSSVDTPTPTDPACPFIRPLKKSGGRSSIWKRYKDHCTSDKGMWSLSIGYQTMVEQLARVLTLQKDDVVLDAAAGCGNMLYQLHRRGVRTLVGFDKTEGAVTYAKTKLLRGLGVQMCRSDVRTISWVPDNNFTVVIAHALIGYLDVEDLCSVVDSFVAKLRVGGRMFLGFYTEAQRFRRTLWCLSSYDVRIRAGREDFLYPGYPQLLQTPNLYALRGTSIVVTLLSRTRIAPWAEYDFHAPRRSEDALWAQVHAAGVTLQYNTKMKTVEFVGACCSLKTVAEARDRAASPCRASASLTPSTTTTSEGAAVPCSDPLSDPQCIALLKDKTAKCGCGTEEVCNFERLFS